MAEAMTSTGVTPSSASRSRNLRTRLTGFAITALSLSSASAQSTCVSLSGSTQCPAFNASSISTDATLRGFFPFLAFVNDVNTFDTQFAQYIASSYSQQKYQQLLGCSNFNLSNTTNLYARYTSTVLCNAIVQNSISACGLTGNAIRPVCADTCAEFARSEESIAATPAVCGVTNNDSALTQIRADFTNCALPANSLTNNCIRGVQNEPNNCGFASNLGSLCSYCAASSPNATDSCCLYSNTETRCQNVRLPITTAMGTLFPSSTSSTPAATSTGGATDPLSRNAVPNGLSGGAIAGIVIGSVLGAILLLALLVFACIWSRRRRESQAGSIFNQPSPSRQGPLAPPSFTGSNRGMTEVLPVGARVHQMTALEDTNAGHGGHSSPIAGAAGVYGTSSTGYDDSPESQRSQYTGGIAGIGKRGASTLDSSPKSDDELSSSPQDVSSGHSEQLASFKDYYSNDDIHPNDAVSVLWAYQPRANDEWELERGDMIKVVGIWDDGWATGMRVSTRAEDYEMGERNPNRDSGLSTGGERQVSGESAPGPGSEIKAFPLVCVCLPQHWRKTIEGDTMDPSTPSVGDANSSP